MAKTLIQSLSKILKKKNSFQDYNPHLTVYVINFVIWDKFSSTVKSARLMFIKSKL